MKVRIDGILTSTYPNDLVETFANLKAQHLSYILLFLHVFITNMLNIYVLFFHSHASHHYLALLCKYDVDQIQQMILMRSV